MTWSKYNLPRAVQVVDVMVVTQFDWQATAWDAEPIYPCNERTQCLHTLFPMYLDCTISIPNHINWHVWLGLCITSPPTWLWRIVIWTNFHWQDWKVDPAKIAWYIWEETARSVPPASQWTQSEISIKNRTCRCPSHIVFHILLHSPSRCNSNWRKWIHSPGSPLPTSLWAILLFCQYPHSDLFMFSASHRRG